MAFAVPPTPITVTSLEVLQDGYHGTAIVTVDLPSAVHHFEWYEDGVSVGQTVSPSHSRAVDLNNSVQVECVPTRYADFDPQRNAPQSYPSAQIIQWLSSIDVNVDHYRVDHATGQSTPSTWTDVGRFRHDSRWVYSFRSEDLADLTFHWFRVVPVSVAGNDGTVLTFGPTFHVRRPSAPDFSTTFNDGTDRVTYGAAA